MTVQASHGRRRGLFARCDFKTGELVQGEKAFCIVLAHKPATQTAIVYDERNDIMRAAPLGLHSAVLHKLMDNPSQLEKVLALDGGEYTGVGKKLILNDGALVVDAFQIADIVARNAFGAGVGGQWNGEDEDEEPSRAGAGL